MSKIEKLTADLRKRVRSGEWKTALPNRNHLSAEYGVATGSVSLALRTLEREGVIQILPRKGVVVTDASAAKPPGLSLIGLRGRYVQMGVPPSLGYAGNLVNQLLEAARVKGYPLLVIQTHEQEPPLTKARCKELGLGGLIYLGADSHQEAMDLRLEGFPVISANRPVGRSPLNYIDCDHLGTLRDAISRFIALGHRRIAVVQSATIVPDVLTSLKARFVEELVRHQLYYHFDDYWVHLSKTGSESQAQIDRLFELAEPPTAIFGWNNLSITPILETLSQRGLSVPGDVSMLRAPVDIPVGGQVSGYAYSLKTFGEELLEELGRTITNPFHFVQRDLSFEFVDRGSLASPPMAAR